MGFIDRLKVSTNLLKLNWATLLGVGLAYASIYLPFMKMIFMKMIDPAIRWHIGFTEILLCLLVWLVQVIFLSGYVPLVIDCVKGKKVSISKFGKYINLNNFISFLCLDAIVMAVILAGSLLLLPGIYWAAISVFSYFIVGLRPLYKDTFKAITDSIDASKGVTWHIFGYQAIYAVLSLLLFLVHPIFFLTLGVILTAYYWITIGVLFKERT